MIRERIIRFAILFSFVPVSFECSFPPRGGGYIQVVRTTPSVEGFYRIPGGSAQGTKATYDRFPISSVPVKVSTLNTFTGVTSLQRVPFQSSCF